MNMSHDQGFELRRVAASYVAFCIGFPFSRIHVTVTEEEGCFSAFLNVTACNPKTGEHEGRISSGKTAEAAARNALKGFFEECSRISAIKVLELSDFVFLQPHGYYGPETIF